ncbi:MAG: NAD(P)-dependent alcohol dehydrogenase [Deltaproteobacteria bacterium]|jgi:NADPH:quinone reductase-like Zn-dependent oxidoreductase|nr:NAD(P)-dependent alcohol dehydrogenase [Deltaproteobacteria bacterium]
MKAVVYQKYGSPDVLELKEVEKPTPKDNEVLIKVHAVSVNASDWEFLRGSPLYTRIWGLLKPKYKILGSDIAGRVEAVGRNVTQFQQGDAVFGDILECWGGFAEYVCAPENALILKPASMTFEEAAAVPQAAGVALQGLRDKGQIQPGQKVLINGAGGGAGSFAVQIAKLFGAEVTGVDSTRKLDMMRSIGADQVIDYTQEDFTQNGQRYDLILDLVAYHSIFDYKRALSPKGVYVMVGGSMSHIFQTLFFGSWIFMTGRKKMGILGAKPNKDLAFIIELIESGKVIPVIDRQYPLSEVPEALRYLGEGHAKGKVVITVEHNYKT